jgi:ABC-type amino acid transport substrate-binding protein
MNLSPTAQSHQPSCLKWLKRTTGAICLCLAAQGSVVAAAREVRVAVVLSPPIVGTAAGSEEATAITDLNEALTREICLRATIRCSQHPLPFAEIIPGVESGRYQIGMGNVLRTPEREQRVRFSSLLWRSSSRLIGTLDALKSQSPPDPALLSVETLRNTRVAAVRGSQQLRYLQSLPQANGLRIIETGTANESFEALRSGRADFALEPMRSIYFQFKAAGRDDIVVIGPSMAEHGLGGTVHAILPKGEDELASAVDAALAAMRGDGTFQRILRRHMPFLAD